MSNQLVITVGVFTPLSATEPVTGIMVTARDSYTKGFEEFDNNYHDLFPTKDDLIRYVLQWPEFEDIIYGADGELDGVSSIVVEGTEW